jgi:hypothetical protein
VLLMLALALSVVSLLAPSASLRAQDDKLKDFTFEELPADDTRPPYFVVGGGYIFMPMFQDFGSLNQTVNAFTGGSFTGPVLLSGGQGFVTPGFLNLRLGFSVAGGGVTNESTMNGLTKRASYNILMSGVTVDYAISPFKGFAILPGITLGGGEVSFAASQTSGSRTFGTTFPLPPSQTNYNSTIRAGHIFVQPAVNIEYAPAVFLNFRVNVGYSLSFMQEWRVDNAASIGGVPTSLNASGLTLQAGVFVGLFTN